MQIHVKDSGSAFQPVVVTITIESEVELQAIRAVAGSCNPVLATRPLQMHTYPYGAEMLAAWDNIRDALGNTARSVLSERKIELWI